MKTVEEILDYMDGYRVEGEDGGVVIQELKELLPRTAYLDLGEVKYFGVDQPYGHYQLTLLIFEDENYKFICIEDTEVEVSLGGTCYHGSVEVYKKLTKKGERNE